MRAENIFAKLFKPTIASTSLIKLLLHNDQNKDREEMFEHF
jgi:hypothetical protein